MRKLICELLGVVSKKELKTYLGDLQRANRARKLGQTYKGIISPEQEKKNIYLQGYEDGTDNICNAIYSRFDMSDIE